MLGHYFGRLKAAKIMAVIAKFGLLSLDICVLFGCVSFAVSSWPFFYFNSGINTLVPFASSPRCAGQRRESVEQVTPSDMALARTPKWWA